MSIGSIVGGGQRVIAVSPTASVREIIGLLAEHRIGAVLVIDGDDVAGIVSERDVATGLHGLGAAVLEATAAEVMTSPVITASREMSVTEAMAVMTNRRVRHLPVCDHGALVGLVSIGDLVKRRIEDAEGEAAALKDYIATA